MNERDVELIMIELRRIAAALEVIADAARRN